MRYGEECGRRDPAALFYSRAEAGFIVALFGNLSVF